MHVRARWSWTGVRNASWIVVAAGLIERLVMDLLREIAPMIPSEVVWMVSLESSVER